MFDKGLKILMWWCKHFAQDLWYGIKHRMRINNLCLR